jgi:hypothetical protein
MKNADAEPLQVVVAEHVKHLQKKQTFQVAAKALTSLVQERYTGATPAEQNAVRFVSWHNTFGCCIYRHFASVGCFGW